MPRCRTVTAPQNGSPPGSGSAASELESVTLVNQHYRSFFAGLRVKSEYLIKIPPKWRFEWAGPSLNFEFEYGTMTREIRREDQSVRFTTLLELPARWVAPEETSRFNEFVKMLGREGQMSTYAELTDGP